MRKDYTALPVMETKDPLPIIKENAYHYGIGTLAQTLRPNSAEKSAIDRPGFTNRTK
tara:strand:- start:223 stop:393 length:171 start_codon:yes stop_codon:yes gene_type:complete